VRDYTEQENVRIEQRLKEYDRSAGRDYSAQEKDMPQQGKPKLWEIPGNLVHEAAHETKGVDEYRKAIAELKPHSRKSCRNDKRTPVRILVN
jgi:hypothetical protein